MTREELIEKLGILYDEPWNDVEEYFELVADLVLGNENQPAMKQQTERVSAKEVFLALTSNRASSHTRWEELIPMAHEGAEAFNNSLSHE